MDLYSSAPIILSTPDPHSPDVAPKPCIIPSVWPISLRFYAVWLVPWPVRARHRLPFTTWPLPPSWLPVPLLEGSRCTLLTARSVAPLWDLAALRPSYGIHTDLLGPFASPCPTPPRSLTTFRECPVDSSSASALSLMMLTLHPSRSTPSWVITPPSSPSRHFVHLSILDIPS